MSTQSIIDKVRQEKEEFDRSVEETSKQTQEELVRKDELLPISSVGQRNVLKLFQDYYPPEVLEHLTIEPERAVALQAALKVLSRNAIKSSNPIMCLAQKCYNGERCPIHKAGVAPIGHTCLSKGTKVSLINYEKNIEDVVIGEKTISFDNTQMVEDVVKNVKYMGKKKTYLIKTNRGHEIECTSDHLFYSLCGGLHKRNKISKKNKSILPENLPHKWMSIDDGLQTGSKIALIYGKEEKSIDAIKVNKIITDKFTHIENNILWDYINVIEEKSINDVYDIETEKYHNYIANGIVVHNCPIELMLMDQWEEDYTDDLGIDKQSKVEVDMVRDMVEADLIDWRASHELAKGGLFDWNAIGMSEDGKPIYRKEEAVAIGIKLKFKARKDRIREDLMATRKMRAKFGLAKTMDPSKFAAALQDRYNTIKDAEVVDNESPEEMHEEHE